MNNPFTGEKTNRIVTLVDEMRENSYEMRMWRNIPLAKECIQLMQEIDDRDEPPSGKALACEAVIEQLPEYCVPRFVLGILSYQWDLVRRYETDDLENYPTEKEVEDEIQRLKDYIDTEHVSDEAFNKKYGRHLKASHVERTPQWEELYFEVEKECDRRLGDIPRGMGFCFAYWSTLRQVLAERGISWQSPHELNPRVMFD